MQYDHMNAGYEMEKDLRNNFARGYERFDRHDRYVGFGENMNINMNMIPSYSSMDGGIQQNMRGNFGQNHFNQNYFNYKDQANNEGSNKMPSNIPPINTKILNSNTAVDTKFNNSGILGHPPPPGAGQGIPNKGAPFQQSKGQQIGIFGQNQSHYNFSIGSRNDSSTYNESQNLQNTFMQKDSTKI